MNKDQIIEAIKEMSVLELNELVQACEEEFGVSAAAGVVVAAAGEGGAAAEEQTEFTVVLKEVGAEKIKVIKAVREITGLGLKEAKELVDGYKEAGYDGIVITNHFDKGIMHLWGETTEEHYQTYLRGYELAKEEGERVGLRVILGMEIRLECGPEDYLVYGVTKDFIREHMDICGCSLQELYEICEENGCVLIQAHPFREYCQIQNPKYLHGVERNFNSGHDNHNEKLDAWLKEPGREHLIITRGSDCHEIPQVGLVDFVIDADVKNSTELAQVLKKLV